MDETFIVDDSGLDELSQLLKEPRQNTRHDIWLWLYLNQHKRARFDASTCNGSTMRDEIARFLKRKTENLKGIASKKDRSLVPHDYLKWIEGDERQYQWLLRRVEDLTELRPTRGLPSGLVRLNGRNHLIAILDLWDVDIAKKVDEIEHLRNRWLRHKAGDSAFKWFEDKKDGLKRCKFAWEWLEKNRLSLKRLLPISNYKELLMYFDEAEVGHHELKAILQTIRNRWTRKQFDERAADKKQVNVMLSKTAIELLDTLAKKHELKRAQVLELLITTESEVGVYLTAR